MEVQKSADKMQQDDTQEKEGGTLSRPVVFAVITALLLIVAIFLYPLFRKQVRIIEQFPFLEIEGYWADSTILTLSVSGKSAQMIIRLPDTPALGNAKTILPGIDGSGIMFPPDSLLNYKSDLQPAENLPLPYLAGLRSVDSLKDFPVWIDREGLLSIRNDSLLTCYLVNHLELARYAGATMVIYPLWEERGHTKALPDTLLLQRQVRLTTFFRVEAMKRGMIPVLPLAHTALTLAPPGNFLDSVVNRLFRNIIHQNLPTLLIDTIPASLTQNQGLKHFLKRQYGFSGLIFLKRNTHDNRELINALNCGADLILSAIPVDQIISHSTGKILNDKEMLLRLHASALRVLYFKEWLLQHQVASGQELCPTPSSVRMTQLNLLLLEKSIIRIKDTGNLVPFQNLLATTFLIHLPEGIDFSTFTQYFNYFADFQIRRYPTYKKIRLMEGACNIIVTDGLPGRGSPNIIQGESRRGKTRTKLICLHFGKTKQLAGWLSLPTVVHVGVNNIHAQRTAANFLFGGAACDGMIPWDIHPGFLAGAGLPATGRIRLNYTLPEEIGIESDFLLRIDSIATEAILNGAFPGCQIFIAKDGNVIYHKAFGQTAYENGIPVQWTHLYDIASMTKTAATTLAFMKMYESGRMKLGDILGRFFKDRTTSFGYIILDTLIRQDTITAKGREKDREKRLAAYAHHQQINDTLYLVTDTLVFSTSTKRNVFRIPLRKFLNHQSGLPAALPIAPFLSTFDRRTGTNRFRDYYSPGYLKDSATIRVAKDMYLFNHYLDTLWMRAKATGIHPSAVYLYSDANMVFVQQAIDSVNKKPIDIFLTEEIYKPLGLRNCTFNPVDRFSLEQIVPTANDIRWRKQLIHGYVHDPTAALFGGVAGNAGLFANANDLGVLHQMLLQGGEYGGVRFYAKETVDLFTSRQEVGYRALGFDMKAGEKSITAASASKGTYGHTGFTGTCAWVDPENRIIFVFLSNRIHPNTENQKINYFKVREKIHQVIYDALEASEQDPSE